MVQTSPCSELHPYPQQASSTPTSIVPSSRGLGPGLPSLGVWGLTTLLLCSLDLGTCHHTHTNLSDLPPPGLNLLPSHPWTCSLLTPGPALPCSWVHPQGRMLSGLGPGPQGLGHIQGAPQALLVLLCLGASSPPASLYLRPPKPSPGPSRSQPSSGRA